jgi:flagellar biosynthesis anti-sigma factor FlgM
VAGTYALNQNRNVRRSAEPGATSFRDELVISKEAQDFGSMLKKLKAMDDVRPEKVDFYTKAIQSGRYNVPSADIADKMLGGIF